MTEYQTGDPVVYQSYLGAPEERGTVVRWNTSGTLVFVQFDRGGPQACRPESLRPVDA